MARMYSVPPAWPAWPAVGAQLERRVRRRAMNGATKVQPAQVIPTEMLLPDLSARINHASPAGDQ